LLLFIGVVVVMPYCIVDTVTSDVLIGYDTSDTASFTHKEVFVHLIVLRGIVLRGREALTTSLWIAGMRRQELRGRWCRRRFFSSSSLSSVITPNSNLLAVGKCMTRALLRIVSTTKEA
jgi:hypothetical protein